MHRSCRARRRGFSQPPACGRDRSTAIRIPLPSLCSDVIDRGESADSSTRRRRAGDERTSCYKTRMLVSLLVMAALLEVGGDAAIRRGLISSSPTWLVAGVGLLAGYGYLVNANRTLGFGSVLGL